MHRPPPLRLSRRALVVAAILFAITSSPTAAADEPASSHVRTDDPVVAALIEYASQYSSVFRTLVDRINQSDVVAYVLTDRPLPRRLGGRVAFMSAIGGHRYVAVTLRRDRDPMVLVGFLAHELAHVVEIAGDRSIADAASLRRAYTSAGEVSGSESQARAETWQALALADAVRRDLRTRPITDVQQLTRRRPGTVPTPIPVQPRERVLADGRSARTTPD